MKVIGAYCFENEMNEKDNRNHNDNEIILLRMNNGHKQLFFLSFWFFTGYYLSVFQIILKKFFTCCLIITMSLYSIYNPYTFKQHTGNDFVSTFMLRHEDVPATNALASPNNGSLLIV